MTPEPTTNQFDTTGSTSPSFLAPMYAKSADGTEIAFYDHGGNGPDVVLGHASGFCAAIWCEVIERLTGQFHCVTYDTRGHGKSGQPALAAPRSEAFDWERLADDLDAVIDTAGLDHPLAIGHSSGAAAQVLLSERGDYLAAMYLFEPVIFDFDPPRGPWPDRELAKRTRHRRERFDSRDSALKAFREKGPFASLTNRALKAYVDCGFREIDKGEIELILNPLDEAEIYSLATDHFGYQRLGQITTPTTVAHGETSKSFTHDEMQHVTERIKNANLETFNALGHFAPLEDPGQFVERVTSFFAKTADVTGAS